MGAAWSAVKVEHAPRSHYWYRLVALSRWPVRKQRLVSIHNGVAMVVTVDQPGHPIRILVVDGHSTITQLRTPMLHQSESTASGGETPTGSAVPSVSVRRSSLRKAPRGRRTAHEGLAESVPRQGGLQVSRRHPPEVPSPGVVRADAAGHRPDPAGSVPPEGYRAGGGEGNAGPHPHAVERAPAVQHRDDDRIPEGHECDPDPPGVVAQGFRK